MLDMVEELFQKGVELQKLGKVEVASQFYTAVLESQPAHPDANHNMGVLAVGFDKIQEALPFFEVALEANADTAQFWVSYIDALIKVERMVDAQAVFNQAKDNGAKGEGFDQLEKRLNVPDQGQLETSMTASEAHQEQLNILDSLKEARRIYQDILVKLPKNKSNTNGIKYLAGGLAGKASEVQVPTQDQQQSVINLYNQGQFQLSLKQATALLQQFPSSSFLYNICGAVYKELGQLDASIEAYAEALTIKPDYTETYYNIGVVLQEQGKPEEAIEAYNKAIAIKPDFAKAYYNMGNAIKEQGKLEEAVVAYNKALVIKPDFADAYNNMGVTLQEQGKLEEAIEAFNKALAIKPDFAGADSNMGTALQEQGKLEEAIESYNKAIAIKPDDAEVHNNMGTALQEQGKLEEAIESYNKALAIKPDDADAFYNMSFCKLQTVDWKRAIGLRQYRWKTKQWATYDRSFVSPEWNGSSSLKGKTLLIWGEQGPGDMVIWASCFEYFIPKCYKVIVECSPKLIRLFQLSFPQIEFRAERKNIKNNTEDFDCQVPMETLFGYACLSGFSNNDQKQYLYPDQDRVNYWSNRLKLISDKPCVGISWKSPVMNVKRAKNYANLSYWRPVFKNTNVTFINLQSTDFQKDLNKIHKDFGIDVVHFGEINHYDDLAEVAALSKALDMSISINTAVATITAGVGTTTIIPTWRQSVWNNLLLSSRGPDLEMLYRNSWENWDKTFNKVAEKVSFLVH